jgi:AraC-like DNA-binding protein
MEKLETLASFYKNRVIDGQPMTFNLHRFDECTSATRSSYRRRDFYKVTFMKGRALINYGDKTLSVKGYSLGIFSPDVPYTIDLPDASYNGEYFIFRGEYLAEYFRRNIQDLPLFAPGHRPVFELNEEQGAEMQQYFDRLHKEFATDYAYKHDLIRHAILDVLHYAMRLEPMRKVYTQTDAGVRIAAVFKELLDRQFPVEDLSQQFELKSPADFAARLGVHVNSLNRALRATTGKSTSVHIAERLVSEAIILLRHTDWNVAEIGFSLGFEDPAHFSHFFKRHTGQAPTAARSVPVHT